MRVTISAKASPSAVQPAAHSSASSSVFQATPQRAAAGEAAQAPDLCGEQAVEERRQRNRAVVVLQRAATRIVTTGKNVKIATEQRDRDDAARDERIAVEVAALGQPQREQHRERRRGERRAPPHAVLTGRKRREQPDERIECPALRADGEALGGEHDEAGGADAAAGRRARNRRAMPGASSGAASSSTPRSRAATTARAAVACSSAGAFSLAE